MHPTTSPLFPLPHPSPPHPFFLILSASPLFSISSTCYFHFPTPPFPAASPHPANSSFYHIRCLFPSPIHHLLNYLPLSPSLLALPPPSFIITLSTLSSVSLSIIYSTPFSFYLPPLSYLPLQLSHAFNIILTIKHLPFSHPLIPYLFIASSPQPSIPTF